MQNSGHQLDEFDYCNSQQPPSSQVHGTDQVTSPGINSISNRLMSATLNQFDQEDGRQSKQATKGQQSTKLIMDENCKQGTLKQAGQSPSDATRILNEIGVCVQLSDLTISRAKDVFNAYIKVKRQQQQLNSNQRICLNKPLAMLCAVFIASYFEVNMKTSASKPSSPITLTDIIEKNLLNISEPNAPGQKCQEIDDFITMLKDVQSSLPVQSKSVKETLTKCLGICQNFQSCLKIYNKFDQVWKYMQASGIVPSNQHESANAKRNLKSNLWLFYLVCKHRILEADFTVSRDSTDFQIKNDFCQIQSNIFKQPSSLVDQAFLLIAVCQKFAVDVSSRDQDQHLEQDAQSLKMIQNKIIASNQLAFDDDHQLTIQDFKSKIEQYLIRMSREQNGNACPKQQATSDCQERLDQAFLKENEQSMHKEYAEMIQKQETFDERYFANNSEKIKTPLKMIQSPFNARIGPMQRQSTGLIKNNCLQPPTAPSKRQLFPVFQNGDQVNQVNFNRQSKISSYDQFQRDSLEPPNKRQEVEAPNGNLPHFNGDLTNQMSHRSSCQKDQSYEPINSNGQQSVKDKGNMPNGQMQSSRILDFNELNKPTENPSLQTKLNEVQFPNVCGQTPYINQMQKKFQQSVPNTPITEMMKLRNWFISKVKKTKLIFDESELPAKKLILSQKLLSILEMPNQEDELVFNKKITINCTDLIDKIISGLARSKIQRNNQPHQHRRNHFKRSHDQIVDQKLETQINLLKKKLMQQYFDNIFGMTAQLLEKIFETHKEMGKVAEVKRLINSDIFIKSIIICTTELQYFVYEVDDMQCCEVSELIEQPPFDFWRILSIFLKVYPDMPKRIGLHFREIELRIICFLAWKKGSSVFKIVEFMKQQSQIQSKRNRQSNSTQNNTTLKDSSPELSDRQKQKLVPYNCFFSRVLQASALTIVELCNLLKINAEFQEVIWSITKLLFSCEPNLLIDRHIDQLIMCTIYSVAKISDLRFVTFNSIINRYASMYQNKDFVTQIYTHCVVNQDTGEKKDIINFYNEVYLKKMKQYILLYRDQCAEIKQELEIKSTTASQSQFKNGQCKALTPGNNDHLLQNQSFLGINKPQAQAILTPIGTKMIIKAFCPTIALYDQLGSSKVNSTFRYVVNRGNSQSFSMTEKSTDLSKSKIENVKTQNNGICDRNLNNVANNYQKLMIEQNQINQFQTESGKIHLNEINQHKKDLKGEQKNNNSMFTSQNLQNKNECQSLSKKPPRPQPIANQLVSHHSKSSSGFETWQIINGHSNYDLSGLAQQQTVSNNKTSNIDQNTQNISCQQSNFINQAVSFDQSESKEIVINQQVNETIADNSITNEKRGNCQQAQSNLSQIQVKESKIENQCMDQNQNTQVGGKSSMRMNILNKIKKNCQNGVASDDKNHI